MAAELARQGICLESLLVGMPPASRDAVLDALLRDGFEITHGIPNLQMPEEVDASIGFLREAGHPEAWARLHRTLSAAALDGTLVDLSYGTGGS